MRESLRLSMNYLHTWLGLVLGFVLMAVFFFGSLTVFDREIDRWSVPETRGHAAPLPSFDVALRPLIAGVRPEPESMEHTAKEVVGPLPPENTLNATYVYAGAGHRDPLIELFVSFDVPNKPKDRNVDHEHVFGRASFNPATGAQVGDDVAERLHLGTGFFFPMHYMLHLEWQDIGIWIVGLAGLAMLAALVSGVVIRRRFFREFFTLRLDKARMRSALDVHNVTGVLALPFLFVITFSGLLIFAGFYLPAPLNLMRPLVKAQESVEVARTSLPEHPAGRPGTLASVDTMMAAARARWVARGVPGEIGSVAITHFGDANSYVTISRDMVDRVATREALHFEGATGRVLYENPPARAIPATEGFLYGLHFQQFKHWGLRWLLFVGGLFGCACIATGFLFFVGARKKKHAMAGTTSLRIVDALAVTTVTGMFVATAAILLANRLLPTTLPHHDTWQEAIFWLVWLATLGHALWRSRPGAAETSAAWREQAAAVAALSVAAVLANWVTTGDHLVKTIGERYWPVAGVDLVLLASAFAAVMATRRLGRRSAVQEVRAEVPRTVARPAREPAHV